MGPDKEASLHDYFISCLAAGTGLSPSVVAQHVQNAESVTHFIQDGSCTLLAASHTSKIQNDDDDGRSLLLSNSIHEASRMPDATTYLFVKSSNHFDLSETSVDEIKSSVIMIVSPANSNLFSTLRSSLDSIYAPMVDGCNLSQNHNGELKSDSDWHVTESAKHLIIELENELAFTTSPKSSAVATDVHDISSIRTPMDEIRFWESFDGDEKYASSANQLVSCFSEVKDTFQRICNGTLEQDEHSLTRGNNVDGHSLSETLSWVENEFGDRGNVEGALYNAFLLRCSEGEYIYSPKRMIHIMHTIGNSLCLYLSSCISDHTWLFLGPAFLVKLTIQNVVHALKAFKGMLHKLINVDLAVIEGRSLVGKTITLGGLNKLVSRLEEIFQLRSAYAETFNLLSPEQRSELISLDAFEPFIGVDPLNISAWASKRFDASLRKHKSILSKVASWARDKLRALIERNMDESPLVVALAIKRFSCALDLTDNHSILKSGTDAVLSKLKRNLFHVQESLGFIEDQSRTNVDKIPSSMIKCKQILFGINGVIACCKEFGVHDTINELLSECETITDSCQQIERMLFQTWAQNAIDGIDSGDLPLRTNEKIIDTDKRGMLQVSCDQSLTFLSRDERKYTELGFSIPKTIHSVVGGMEKPLYIATILCKITSFYNSLEHHIIPSQRSMLLDSLMSFENVLQSQAGISKSSKGTRSKSDSIKCKVTWDNMYECERFVEKIHKALDNLKDEIGELRSSHNNLTKKMLFLTSLDLLTQKKEWMDQWKNVEKSLKDTCQKYSPQLTSKWVTYWDKRVYDALDSSYRRGLPMLHEHVGSFSCELTITSGTISFHPDLSSLKSTFISRVSAFIDFPGSKFKGLNNSDMFGTIKTNHVGLSRESMKDANQLIKRLEEFPQKYSTWLSIFAFDDTASSFSDFNKCHNFIDQIQQDLANLPDYEMVGCITVSLTKFNRQLRCEAERCRDCLRENLTNSVSTQCKDIENYLESSVVVLKQIPTTLAELAQSQKYWKQVVENKSSFQSKVIDCKKKLDLNNEYGLIDTTGLSERVTVLENFQGEQWTSLNVEIAAFSDVIASKKEFATKTISKELELLEARVDSFRKLWESATLYEVKDLTRDAVEVTSSKIKTLAKDFQSLREEADSISESCAEFGVDSPNLNEVHVIQADVDSVQERTQLLLGYVTELDELKNKKWLSFHSSLFELEDFCSKWSRLIQEQEEASSYSSITHQLQLLKLSLPALRHSRGDSFREDHWVELLQGKLGLPGSVRIHTLTFAHFVQSLDWLASPESCKFTKALQEKSQGEALARETLNEFIAWYQTFEIELFDHTLEERYTPLIQHWKEIFIAIGDKQNLLSALDSQQFTSFKDASDLHQLRLDRLETILRLLNDAQRKWLSLEPIYAKNSLPSEHSAFAKVDDHFRSLMENVKQNPKISNIVEAYSSQNDLVKLLRFCIAKLDNYQQALNSFLEDKRLLMPRLFFVGDDDLLEILGIQSTGNIFLIQRHLKSLFMGVDKINFHDGHIISFESSLGEVVELENGVFVTESTEVWLAELSAEHKHSMAVLLPRCSESTAGTMLPDFPSQILEVSEALNFSISVEKAIKNRDVILQLKDSYEKKILSLARCKSFENKLSQSKKNCIILDIMHYLEVIEYLAKSRVSSVDDWAWQKQLRYYNNGINCFVEMSGARFDYSFEYQGNQQKLVYTPLTDKCYLNLTQALRFGFGGNPFGPAGTGKTETVKALGASLGRHVLVFNCDEGINISSMGRMFIGIVSSGAWGCFDEFNRLKIDQLSGVSHQIQLILDAVKNKKANVCLLGIQVKVNSNTGIFVTLNPAGKEYKGRSALPANLKALFRPVAMTRPDNTCIVEATLLAEGFSDGKVLSKKIVLAFGSLNRLLSMQSHYDWSLRALKAVLQTACKIFSSRVRETDDTPTTDEQSSMVVRAIQMNILPKLSQEDTVKCNQLLADIFVGISVSNEIDTPTIKGAILEVLRNSPFNLECDEHQMSKVIQLNDLLSQRIGCVIAGPASSGKSTIWKLLHASLAKTGTKITIDIINPKSMSREKLLGFLDHDTREWNDGVLISAARNATKTETKHWIVCDGDLDPEWIEALNSVLDDNRLLTLPNGERISVGEHVNFLFETHDLSFASPATISRMGMLHINEDMNAKSIVSSWLKGKCKGKECQDTVKWIEHYFFKALDARRGIVEVVSTSQAGIIRSALLHISGTCDSESVFLQKLATGLGCNMTIADRHHFIKHVKSMSGELAEPSHFKSHQNDFTMQPPIDTKGKATIMTDSALGVLSYVKQWVDNDAPFLLVGPFGCGKECIIDLAFSSKSGVEISTFHCDEFTEPSDLLNHIKRRCSLASSSGGQVYRPRTSPVLALLIKDIDLVRLDEYGTCSVVSLLQYILTYGGFYDEGQFTRIERIRFAFTINGVFAQGRNPICKRFTALTHIASMGYPAEKEMVHICMSLLEKVDADIQADGFNILDKNQLATAMVEAFEKIQTEFTGNPNNKGHFSPLRCLSSWIKNLGRYSFSKNPLDCIVYEAHRLFGDPLMDAIFRNQLHSILESTFKKHFDHSVFHVRKMHFSSIKRDGIPSSSNIACPLSSSGMSNAITMGLDLYSREYDQISIILHSHALQQFSSVAHALTSKSGHALLIGMAGSGRRNMVRLICFLHEVSFRSPCTSLGYNIDQFLKELKNVLINAGINNQRTCLYIEDHHICSPIVIAIVSRILSSTSIFSDGELEPFLAQLHGSFSDYTDENEGDSNCLVETFDNRVRKNLQIVLSLNPSNNDVVLTIEKHPAILRNCSIICFDRASCLQEIISMSGLIQEFALTENINDRTIPGQSKFSCKEDFFHGMAEIAGKMYAMSGACPADFYSCLSSWRCIYKNMITSKEKELTRTRKGLTMITLANEEVAKMKAIANKQMAELQVAQSDADDAMTAISNELSKAQLKSKEIEQLKLDLAEKSKETIKRKSVIEDELRNIQPILDAAKEAVNGIRRDNLDEIRSLKTPPSPIVDVLSGVLMLLGIKDLTWLSMKKFLGQRGVKEDIINFNSMNLPPEVTIKVEALVRKKSQSFDATAIKKVSIAAAPLAAWVKANLQYARVLKNVTPLQADLDEAENELQMRQEEVDNCDSEILSINTNVENLREKFSDQVRNAEVLKENLRMTNERLETAEHLLVGLNNESVRWQDSVIQLENELDHACVQSLLFSGFITYLSDKDGPTRNASIQDWIRMMENVPESSAFDFDLSLVGATEVQRISWRTWGLPTESLYLENAIIISNAGGKVPYIIDPSEVSLKWLREFLCQDGQQVEFVAITEESFCTVATLCVKFGFALVVTDCIAIPSILYPLIRREVFSCGGRTMIKIGDKSVDFNDRFKLIMTSRNHDQSMPPSSRGFVLPIVFNISEDGLENQILDLVVRNVLPEVEERRHLIVSEEKSLQVELISLEENLLEALSSAEGNLLENKSLIQILSETKEKSSRISDSLSESAKATREINAQSDIYRIFATYASRMFILIQSLDALNDVYRFGLDYFLDIVKCTLDDSSFIDNEVITSKIEKTCSFLLKSLVSRIGKSIFKQDKLSCVLHLVHGLNSKPWGDSWGYILGQPKPKHAASFPSWVTEKEKHAFSELQAFAPAIFENNNLDSNEWKTWATEVDGAVSFPKSSRLSAIERLLLVHAVRPTDFVNTALSFCSNEIGIASLFSSDSSDVSSIYQDARRNQVHRPILYISLEENDPGAEIEEFAQSTVGIDRYSVIAMTTDQKDTALNLLRVAAKNGSWVCLKNLQLVIDWLPTLARELRQLKQTKVHFEFQLWLTAEHHVGFSEELLEHCEKIAFEPPQGLQQNMLRTYSTWEKNLVWNDKATQEINSPGLYFAVAWIHSLLQERNWYDQQVRGETINFGRGELKAAELMVKAGTSSLDALHSLMKEYVYGGKLDDAFDVQIVGAYVRMYLSDKSIGGNPNSSEFSSHYHAISKIPLEPNMCLLGLPNNSNRSLQQALCVNVTHNLKRIELGRLRQEKNKDEKILTVALSPIADLWNELINEYRQLSSKKVLGDKENKSSHADGSSPLQIFLNNEERFGQHVFTTINKWFEELNKIISTDDTIICQQQQSYCDALLRGEVPEQWRKLWEGPKEATQWLNAMCARLSASLDRGVRDVLESPVKLSDFFFPDALLGALHQETARIEKCSMNDLTLSCSFKENRSSISSASVCIESVVLQGAVLNTNNLSSVDASSPQFSEIPPIIVSFNRDSEPNLDVGEKLVVPVLLFPWKNQVIMEVPLPCANEHDKMKWILCGVKLFVGA